MMGGWECNCSSQKCSEQIVQKHRGGVQGSGLSPEFVMGVIWLGGVYSARKGRERAAKG